MGVWESPAWPLMGDPGASPRRVSSCSVVGEAQPTAPSNSESFGGAAFTLSADRSNGGIVVNSGEKFGGVCEPGVAACEGGVEVCGVAWGCMMDAAPNSLSRSGASSFGVCPPSVAWWTSVQPN